MFDPGTQPRLFGVPPGADFPRVLVDKVLEAYDGRPPEDLARVRILVNTRRMERRLRRLFQEGNARLLPKIGLVTAAEKLLPGMDLPPSVSRLRRKLELAQLTTRLIEAEPDLAARTAAVDLADTLASLLDEMQGEGMDPARLETLNVEETSVHWERSLKFLRIAQSYLEQIKDDGLDEEARRRLAVEQVCEAWEHNPPQTPVILAGSTGSRATTRKLMCAVANLPQGALLLPGFDFDLPSDVWATLAEGRANEDHAQFRFAALLKALVTTPERVVPWGLAPDNARNRLVSLSLRPAQITDQWLGEGPSLPDLRKATAGLTLIEAPNRKDEASAIAVAMREALEMGKKVALITPDRMLTRRVTTALARWKVVPDDSAGVPLSLTPPGRLLRQVARAMGKPAAPDTIIALLKHPLTQADKDVRGIHLRHTRRFELFLRSQGCFVITNSVIDQFVESVDANIENWAGWLRQILSELSILPPKSLESALARHIGLAELLAQGNAEGSGSLWQESAGEACKAVLDVFLQEKDFAGPVAFSDYARLIETALQAESDRVPTGARPDVMIWGTLEARVQGADLVILGGLNEGIWPEASAPDPWLNRAMRRELGLLLPEGQVGLAAHDYQQAVAAPEVFLCRAKRGDNGEAVPSRWLNRLTNLLSGLPDQFGTQALELMKARGSRYLSLASALDRPGQIVSAAPRPAPAPPSVLRPKTFSVTEIARLIRDPYAIYAKHVLRLRPLLPLVVRPDARMKGIVFHEIVREFFDPSQDFDDLRATQIRLSQVATGILAESVPWPAIRNFWAGQLDQIADHLFESEILRRADGTCVASEVKGHIEVVGGFVIKGTADRIDRLTEGDLAIFDYKTGSVPTKKQVEVFDKQLLIEAVMAEAGGFDGIASAAVSHVAYLHLGRSAKDRTVDLAKEGDTVTVSGDLAKLLARCDDRDWGYISRRAMEKVRYEGDYDHLARFGEWDESAESVTERLG